MLKELAEKIEQLVEEKVKPEIVEHEGVDYIKTSHGFELLRKPSTKAIEVNSLEGLVKMIKNSLRDAELDGMYGCLLYTSPSPRDS